MVEKKKITSFDLGISLCEEYVKSFRDLKPKRTYVTEDGYPFGRWILYQREKYNKGQLTDEQIILLESVGMVWSTENHGSGISFKEKFDKFKNNLNSSDPTIKRFVQDLRSAKRNKGPYAGKLTESMVSELLSLGFVFDLNESSWDDMYYSLIPIHDKYGTISKEYCSDKQWTWVRHQKEKIDELSIEKQLKLSEIGIGNNSLVEQWNDKYKVAREYYISNEHLLVPYATVINGVRLGEWISRQRKRYLDNNMESYQVEKLEEIGMVWDISTTAWMSKYQIAKRYFDTYGTIDIPAVFEFDGTQLGTWIYNQKQAYWANKLDESKQKLLDKLNINWEHKYGLNTSIREKIVAYYLMQLFDNIEFSYHASWLGAKELDIFIPELNLAIEYDGERWHSDYTKDLEKDILCEENNINLIRIREPNCPGYNSKSFKMQLTDLSNTSLCQIINQVVQMINIFFKTDYKLNICFERDYPLIVQMFSASQVANRWIKMYDLASEYYREHGNLLVPQGTIYKDKPLGNWIYLQRQAIRPDTKYVITPKQIELLNQIDMVWDVYDMQFNDAYELAKELHQKTGKLSINTRADKDAAKVANWIIYTRRLKQDGKLSPDKLAKYNEIEALIKKDEEQ